MTTAAPPRGRVLQNFGVILGGELVGQLIAFIVGVYLARTLGAQDFGVLVFASTLILYLLVFVDGGTESWGTREVGARQSLLRETVKNILVVRACLGGVVTLLLVALAHFAGPDRQWALIAGIASIVAFVLQTNWAHRALESAAPAGALLFQRLLFLVLAVSLIRSVDQAPEAILLQGVAEVAAAVLLLGMLRVRLRGQSGAVSRGSLIALLRSAWPFCASRALRGLPVAVVTAGLSFFWLDAETGYFGAAFRVAMLLLVAGSSFGLATFPALTRAGAIGGEAEVKAVSAVVRLLAIVVLPVAVGGIILAQPLIEFLFARVYVLATGPLQLLFVSMLLAALSDNLRRVLHVRRRQHEDLVYVAASTGVALLSAVALLPNGGALGASAALLIGEAVLLVVVWRALYRGSENWTALKRDFGAAAIVSVLVAACALVGALLPFVAAAGLVALAYVAALWRLRASIAADLATLDIAPLFGAAGVAKDRG